MPHVQRRRSGSAEHASGRRAPGSQWDPGPNIRSGPIRVPFAIEMSQTSCNMSHTYGPNVTGRTRGQARGLRTGDSHGGCPPRRTPREGWRRGQQKRGERATEACAVWCCGVGPARASRADCPCKGSGSSSSEDKAVEEEVADTLGIVHTSVMSRRHAGVADSNFDTVLRLFSLDRCTLARLVKRGGPTCITLAPAPTGRAPLGWVQHHEARPRWTAPRAAACMWHEAPAPRPLTSRVAQVCREAPEGAPQVSIMLHRS